MEGGWWTRFVVMIVAMVAGVILLIPTFYAVDEDDPDSWPGWYAWLTDTIDARITPGLDLQGGLHLQYQVDVDRAISDRVDRYVEDLRRMARRSHPDARVTVERLAGTPAIRVRAEGIAVRDVFDDDTIQLMNLRVVPEAGGAVRYEMDSEFIEQQKAYAIEQAIETIRRRIDALGVAEPSLSRRGETDIIVQLPGLNEEQFEQAKELIGTTAQLQFKMVHPQDRTFFTTVDLPEREGVTMRGDRPQGESLEVLRELFRDVEPPAGTEVRFIEVEQTNRTTAEVEVVGYQPMLLSSTAQLTGEYITDARVAVDPRDNRPYVSLTFDATGARLFADLTGNHVDEQMAIVLDDIISSAPRINERIAGGRAQITMGRSGSYNEIYNQSERLVIVLRNGALPAPIELQFETQVGPTLGAESVRSGAISLTVAFLLVLLFILWYYKLAGLIANVALFLNVIFILSILAFFNATLTLPGIAGITLTIGMAIDANVIIFERIKEELRLGKTLRSSVESGYAKAFSAIIDANVTTGIACIVLMTYGSGPIRGFALTLLVGVFCSLYTALIITRIGFDYLLDGAKVSRISF
ncbi:MAG: protein translocase subunit SecD [Deltaproteobacteria bacterium]|nr:MAG: protein translocase subunit SecD [Deltaproteobacteria bacterium]